MTNVKKTFICLYIYGIFILNSIFCISFNRAFVIALVFANMNEAFMNILVHVNIWFYFLGVKA